MEQGALVQLSDLMMISAHMRMRARRPYATNSNQSIQLSSLMFQH